MSSGAPQWLASAIDDALVNLGATVSAKEREVEVDRILQSWDKNVGPFPGLRFLSAMLEKLDLLDGPASDSDLLRLVMTYRVTQVAGNWNNAQQAASSLGIGQPDPQSFGEQMPSDDEEGLTLQHRLEALGVPKSTATRAKELLRQLRHHHPDENDFDAKILVDADMSVLAAVPQDYKKLTTTLYADSAEPDPERFFRERRKFVRHLLDSSTIFYTPVAAAWEEPARTNLEAELVLLDGKLRVFGQQEDVQEKPAEQRRPSGKAQLVRTSLAKKIDAIDKTEESESPARVSTLLKASSLSRTEENEGEEEDFSSTSTLESVADLIERGRQSRASE